MSFGTHWRCEVEDGRCRDTDGQAVGDDGVVTPVVSRLVTEKRELLQSHWEVLRLMSDKHGGSQGDVEGKTFFVTGYMAGQLSFYSKLLIGDLN